MSALLDDIIRIAQDDKGIVTEPASQMLDSRQRTQEWAFEAALSVSSLRRPGATKYDPML